MRIGSLIFALLIIAGITSRAAGAQNPASPAPATPGATPGTKPVPDPESLRVELLNQIPSVDRSNLHDYWASVESRTKDRWIQELPELAKPPVSTPGLVKIDCWLHTDGRVTNMVLEHPSGKVALDRAAWAAITGSVPYDAFPYGISVPQVKVRFTFTYNGGVGGAPPGALPGGVKLPH